MNKIILSIVIVLVGGLNAVLITQHPRFQQPITQESVMNNDIDMGMMGNTMEAVSERAFIEHMIPHHEEAITTAQEVLERGGTSSGMVELANNIITSQTVEVALMKESYEEWYGTAFENTSTYQPMMRELAPYSGAELDSIFLHDMSMHHMGAIMIARAVQPAIEHDVMTTLTANIIKNQTEEIKVMQQLFASIGHY